MIKTYMVSLFLFSLTLTSIQLKAQNEYVLATNNPFDVVTIGNFASPALGDIDNDGDFDLFIGQNNSNDMLFYRNVGTSNTAIYEEQMDNKNPLDTYINSSGGNSPRLVDIDNDNDLDAFVGTWQGTIRYYHNKGTSATPDYVPIYGMDNPLNGVTTPGDKSYPSFVDIDNDGDLDLFVTDADGNILFYSNEGNPSKAMFIRDSLNNPFNDINFTSRVRLIFYDVNDNGLYDVVVSLDLHQRGPAKLQYYQNVGTKQNAIFESRTGNENPFSDITSDFTGNTTLVPAFVDIDDDGDDDLVVGSIGKISLYLAQKNSSNEDNIIQNYKVYPNPTNGLITIEGNDLFTTQLINSTGKIIYTRSINKNNIQLDISHLPHGIYIFKIKDSSSQIIKKFILH